MLNSNNERELAYFVTVTDITPIEGADRIELVHINGWTCVCGKGENKVGDTVVFFEIDSKLPEVKPFTDMEFLTSKHYKIKTQKIRGAYSQGLIMPISAFKDTEFETAVANPVLEGEGRFLTNAFRITYAVEEDNVRKASTVDKYRKMAQRHQKLFAKKPIRWLMHRNWGKKLLFLFFGRNKDKSNCWPSWVVKTDEERIQNQIWRFSPLYREKNNWIVTEKIDGTSTTFTYKVSGKDKGYYVCSRNCVFESGKEKCFYDKNVYLEMSEKYHMRDVLKDLAKKNNLEWVTIQGETYGGNIQKRDYSMTEHDFRAFNLIYSTCGRLNSVEACEILYEYGIPWVPIVDTSFTLPETVDDLLEYAGSANSMIDGGMREGVVLRSFDGKESFKAVSNAFLLKYHV